MGDWKIVDIENSDSDRLHNRSLDSREKTNYRPWTEYASVLADLRLEFEKNGWNSVLEAIKHLLVY